MIHAAVSHKRYVVVFNPFATGRTTKASKCTRIMISQMEREGENYFWAKCTSRRILPDFNHAVESLRVNPHL